MSKYLGFAGENYYPNGGMSDFVGVFDTADAVADLAKERGLDWYHVCDRVTLEPVRLERLCDGARVRWYEFGGLRSGTVQSWSGEDDKYTVVPEDSPHEQRRDAHDLEVAP